MSANKHPNMIVVGAGKAGTTSLHRYLSSHPRVFGTKEKELMYFTKHFDKGPKWLEPHFPEGTDADIFFETTPQYSFRDDFPGVPQRIHEFDPDMKILYVVREPLSRIVSHFNHWAATKPDKFNNLEKSLSLPEHRKVFVDRTRYHYQISAYLDVFPTEQVRVVFLEDLKNNFEVTLNSLFEFLGVPQTAAEISPEVFNRGTDRDIRGPQWRVGNIPPQLRTDIAKELAEDVQKLLKHCGKPADYWGQIYL
ncbi:sulfotransferase family protein [Shimia sp. MIT1388]|uniref:sulfotransferase family protein n=1 Tax=Shimia sp. MIT1388 TaxID=3096992 RepID=UPI00399A0883